MLWLALGVGLFFAMNIGASGTAAAMSAAYGAGAVRKRMALLLVALFALSGAVIAGHQVTVTVGKGMLPGGLLPATCAVVILGAACLTLFLANVAGIPLSTSEVTVGSVMGTALVLGILNWAKVALIVLNWVVVPLLSFVLAYLLQRTLGGPLRPILRNRRSMVALVLTAGGCYEAFAAGSNNVANAVGPLVGAGLIGMPLGIAVGGAGLALGALTLGGRVLNTNAKKITTLDLLGGTIVSFVGASLVVTASILGFPTPLTQVTTMGIVGVGYANGGASALNPLTLRRVAAVWLVSPVVSLAVSFAGSSLVLGHVPPLPTSLAVVASAAAALWVGRSLTRHPEPVPAQAETGAPAEAVPAPVLHDQRG